MNSLKKCAEFTCGRWVCGGLVSTPEPMFSEFSLAQTTDRSQRKHVGNVARFRNPRELIPIHSN
ncbi:hypothetical protein [Pseudomonas fluorescens]|nr:hypothetical protein [Pseudomonas fluorescens]